MIRDDIIRMARKAGLKVGTNISGVTLVGSPLGKSGIAHLDIEEMERFAALIAAAEREECAKVCEAQRSIEWMTASIARVNHEPANIMADSCAAAIRARGEK